jgi:hypothetical protein
MVTRETLGEGLHAALLSDCDSNATSLAWDLISLWEMHYAWQAYLDLAWEELSKRPVYEPVENALRRASGRMGSVTGVCPVRLRIIRLTLELFSGVDWQRFASCLEES